MNTTRPIHFLAFANDHDERARSLRNLAEEARLVQRALAACTHQPILATRRNSQLY